MTKQADITQQLKRLKALGYSCEFPDANLRPMLASGSPSNGAVYLERDERWPRWVYLERGTSTVLIADVSPGSKPVDYPLDEFERMDVAGWPEESKPVKVLPGQKALFD